MIMEVGGTRAVDVFLFVPRYKRDVLGCRSRIGH